MTRDPLTPGRTQRQLLDPRPGHQVLGFDRTGRGQGHCRDHEGGQDQLLGFGDRRLVMNRGSAQAPDHEVDGLDGAQPGNEAVIALDGPGEAGLLEPSHPPTVHAGQRDAGIGRDVDHERAIDTPAPASLDRIVEPGPIICGHELDQLTVQAPQAPGSHASRRDREPGPFRAWGRAECAVGPVVGRRDAGRFDVRGEHPCHIIEAINLLHQDLLFALLGRRIVTSVNAPSSHDCSFDKWTPPRAGGPPTALSHVPAVPDVDDPVQQLRRTTSRIMSSIWQ
jgi:hypothetical protein